jgi:hypothetical protein
MMTAPTRSAGEGVPGWFNEGYQTWLIRKREGAQLDGSVLGVSVGTPVNSTDGVALGSGEGAAEISELEGSG